MKKLFFLLGLLLSWQAHAQTSAPSTRYFLGPSIGEQWAPSSSYVGGFTATAGTTYTVLRTDIGKIIAQSNAGAITTTIPVATTAGFEAGKCFVVVANGAGDVTLTPTTSTINGAATLVVTHAATGVRVCSDGTNYFAF
jgi:hypothetical protein